MCVFIIGTEFKFPLDNKMKAPLEKFLFSSRQKDEKLGIDASDDEDDDTNVNDDGKSYGF